MTNTLQYVHFGPWSSAPLVFALSPLCALTSNEHGFSRSQKKYWPTDLKSRNLYFFLWQGGFEKKWLFKYLILINNYFLLGEMNKAESMKSGHRPHSNFQMSLIQNSLGKIFNFVFLFIGGVFWNINDKLNQPVESKERKWMALTCRHKESSLKCHQELRALHPSTGLVGKEQPLFRRAWNPLCHLDLSWPIKFFSDIFFTCQVCLWGPQWEENVLLTSLQVGSPVKIDSSSASHWRCFIGCFSSSFWSKALSNGTQWNDWFF